MYLARRPLAMLTLIALPLLAGCDGGSGSAGPAPTPTPSAHRPGCVPDPGDGRGGPYPSSVTSLCTGAKLVEIDVIADLKLGGGFSPSNITISTGTTVLFVWKSGGHNLHPFHDQIEDGGFTFRKTFSRPGAYAYDCQIHPGQNGIIHVI